MNNKERVVLKYLKLNGLELENLSEDTLKLLDFIDHRKMIAKYVIADRLRGTTLGSLAIKYALSQRQVKHIINKSRQ